MKTQHALNVKKTNEIKKIYTLDFSGYEKDRVYNQTRKVEYDPLLNPFNGDCHAGRA